uniref:Uncharacterized protein n=1 Tax=Oryza sativa subsp. japonica TaxID=39947 RepID=Q6ZH28_ORYSJ|nr:hypothetical protein [Oryza sativa Japonica Group]
MALDPFAGPRRYRMGGIGANAAPGLGSCEATSRSLAFEESAPRALPRPVPRAVVVVASPDPPQPPWSSSLLPATATATPRLR